ncbi:MAG: hypothetical protein J6A75_07905 [Lachnospiraceae bacterium]|nr:hypothetical protein [Lachnospiraceae bacterium]
MKKQNTDELKRIGHNIPRSIEEKEECLLRHHNLTQFLQMTCGLNEDVAEENACRMEHIISGEVVQGIREFLKYGDTYDRVVRDYDLRSVYEKGCYEFCMGMYRIEQRNPRVLAEEAKIFSDKVDLEVRQEKCYFYLKVKNDFAKNLWYLDKKKWVMAKKEENRYRISAGAFVYVISSSALITECDCVIGFTEQENLPTEDECRELNIHIW